MLDQAAHCLCCSAVKPGVEIIEPSPAIVWIPLADVCVPDIVGVHHIGNDGIQHHRPHSFLGFQPLLLRRIAQGEAALSQFFQLYLQRAVTVAFAVHEKRCRELEHHFPVSSKADLALLCFFRSHPFCPDLIGQLLRHRIQPGERDRFLQGLSTHIVFQLSTRQCFRIMNGAVVMDIQRFLDRIFRQTRLFVYHRFAFSHVSQAEEQAVSAVRNAEPALLAEIHRQVHAEAILQVDVGILVNGFGICLSLLLERNAELLLLFLQAVVYLDPGAALFIVDSIGIGRREPAPVRHPQLLDILLPSAFIFAYRDGILFVSFDPSLCFCFFLRY